MKGFLFFDATFILRSAIKLLAAPRPPPRWVAFSASCQRGDDQTRRQSTCVLTLLGFFLHRRSPICLFVSCVLLSPLSSLRALLSPRSPLSARALSLLSLKGILRRVGKADLGTRSVTCCSLLPSFLFLAVLAFPLLFYSCALVQAMYSPALTCMVHGTPLTCIMHGTSIDSCVACCTFRAYCRCLGQAARLLKMMSVPDVIVTDKGVGFLRRFPEAGQAADLCVSPFFAQPSSSYFRCQRCPRILCNSSSGRCQERSSTQVCTRNHHHTHTHTHTPLSRTFRYFQKFQIYNNV